MIKEAIRISVIEELSTDQSNAIVICTFVSFQLFICPTKSYTLKNSLNAVYSFSALLFGPCFPTMPFFVLLTSFNS